MTGSQPPAAPEPTSLLGQFQRTRESLMGLLHAHIELFKAEMGDILGEVKIIAALAAVAVAVALLSGILLWVGGFLFLGEWLFGSMGWGLAQGFLLGIALIVAATLAIVGSRARYTVASLVVSVLIVIAVAALCGSNVAYNAAAQVSPDLASPLGAPGVIALLGGIVLGAILFGFLLAFAAGRRGAVLGVILGIFLGAIVGWLIAGAPWTWPPAAGFSITIGLVAWPILSVVFAWPHLDPAARFKKLYPQQSIEAMEETRTWLEEQWQTRLPTRGNK